MGNLSCETITERYCDSAYLAEYELECGKSTKKTNDQKNTIIWRLITQNQGGVLVGSSLTKLQYSGATTEIYCTNTYWTVLQSHP
jgi:hypothetical protein